MATTAEVLEHHLTCFGAGDLDGIMADYNPDTVLFTPQGPLNGAEAIRELFAGMIAEFGKPDVSFELVTQSVDGECAYIFWQADTPDNSYEAGTDTFVIRDGKIVAQSFAAKITPKA